MIIKRKYSSCTFKVRNLGQSITELLAVRRRTRFFDGFVDNVHGIISLGSKLIRFMSVFSNEGFTEILSFFTLPFRVPRRSYHRTIGSGTSLFDIFRTVESVVADNRLVHPHFTGFLSNESAFLIEACHGDDIRIGSLDFCQLCREIRIFIGKGLRIDDFDTVIGKDLLINLAFTNHLVVIVGI